MYLGICEWQGTWRDRAREMRNGWKDRKVQRAEKGETVTVDKRCRAVRERDRRQDGEARMVL